MKLDASSIEQVIARVIELLETKCIRLNGAAIDWTALFSAQREPILRCETVHDLENSINAVLTCGGVSHVAFFHEQAHGVPARYAICATFCTVDGPTGPRWAFQDVLDGGPAHEAGVRPGEVLLAVDGNDTRPPTVVRFSLGTDTVLTIQGLDGSTREAHVILPKADSKGKGRGKPPMAEPTSLTYQVLQHDVGYVRIAFFPGVTGQGFARQLRQALDELTTCTRLIVDLRGNIGGFLGSLRLMSYLTPERVPVGYSLTRRGEDRGLRPEQLACIDKLPDSTLERLMMVFRFTVLYRDRSVRLTTEGLGARRFHGRVAIIVNEHTASAAEMAAAFARENKLATLVGTRTAGQVLGGANFRVGNGFRLRLPAAGWYTWKGEMVEGRGVSPNVDVPLSIPALRAGRDNQLEAAVDAVRAT